jgi:hypothetical protein
MAKIKGIQLNAIMKFLKKRYGEDRVKALIGSLPAEDRILLPPVLLDSNWYPYEVLRAVRKISRGLAAEKDESLAVDMGRYIADYAFAGVYRSIFVRQPIKQVQKFSWVHDFFYQDAQTLETEIVSETSCVIRYRYLPGVKPARSTCASTMGFWIRTIELSGGSNVKASHDKCVIDGHDCCEFSVVWQ